MILTVAQLNALCRFNRNFAVVSVDIAEVTTGVTVIAKLKAGKNEIEKRFILDKEGQLVKNNENTEADA